MRGFFTPLRLTEEKYWDLVKYVPTTPDDPKAEFGRGFRKSLLRGMSFFATDSVPVARSYTDVFRAAFNRDAEPAILPLYLSIQNPLVIDAQGQNWKNTELHVEQARAAGHDGIIIRNSVDFYQNKPRAKPCTVYVFFNPTQAKSALTGPLYSTYDRKPILGTGPNDGTWDADDPDLRSNPLAYHGSRKAFLMEEAYPSGGWYGPGLYFTSSLEEAKTFAERPALAASGPKTVIHACDIEFRNPILYHRYVKPTLVPFWQRKEYAVDPPHKERVAEILLAVKAQEKGPQSAIRELQALGFDGIVVDFQFVGDRDDTRKWYAVFDPRSLRCVTQIPNPVPLLLLAKKGATSSVRRVVTQQANREKLANPWDYWQTLKR